MKAKPKTIEEMRDELLSHTMLVEELRAKVHRLDDEANAVREALWQAESTGGHLRKKLWEEWSGLVLSSENTPVALVVVPAPGDRCGGSGQLTGTAAGKCPGCRACS